MSQNWMRHFELQLTDDNGQGISLSDFKVTFDIEWTNTIWPRVALVKIYNLTKDTNSRILGSEFSKIKMIAGYDGIYDGSSGIVPADQVGIVRNIDASQVGQIDGQNFGDIFNGEIRFTVTGRDNPTDTYILIQAIDGHRAFEQAQMVTTLAAGYTVADLHAAAMKSFSPFGVTQGITGAMPDTVFPRGRVMYGMTRNVMKDVAAQCNANWQLVDGQVQMVPTDKYIHEAIVLNSGTGLIGMPQQTMGAGVNARCLINPNIRVGGLIELDQTSVYRASLSSSEVQALPGRASETDSNGNLTVSGTLQQPASVATDGVYIVQSISYTADTRGQPWYMDLMCFARGSADLMSASAKERALP